MLKRRVTEARGRLRERDSASTRSVKSLNVLEKEVEHHHPKEILPQHSVTGEISVEDVGSGASGVEVNAEPAQPQRVPVCQYSMNKSTNRYFSVETHTAHLSVSGGKWLVAGSLGKM